MYCSARSFLAADAFQLMPFKQPVCWLLTRLLLLTSGFSARPPKPAPATRTGDSVTDCLQNKGKGRLPVFTSLRVFLQQCYHNWLLAVPAGLYSLNNYLKFAMQLYFKPTTAKMLSNLKVC